MNNIFVYRYSEKMTLKELARLTGLSVGYLSHLENNTRKNPSKEVMEKIASALNKTVAEVFYYIDDNSLGRGDKSKGNKKICS